MLKIAIAVSDLLARPGGAASVASWMMEALAGQYETSLYVSGDEVDFAYLNRLYGTSLRRGEFRDVCYVPTFRHVGKRRIARQLRCALFARALRLSRDRYDLYVSALNEIWLPQPHLQYIHFPQHALASLGMHSRGFRFVARLLNEGLFRAFGGYSKRAFAESRVLVNSCFTRDAVRTIYGKEAQVIYPPIVSSGHNPAFWRQRDRAVIVMGRFHPDKQMDKAIELVDRLRLRDPAMNLHIVGFDYGNHKQRLLALGECRPHVTLHHEISRDALNALMLRTQYGVHLAVGEHFGMAPAETAASGCVTFVHNSGGQVEVVGNDPRLRFSDMDELVTKITHVMENPNVGQELSDKCREFAEARFGKDRFLAEIRKEAERAADEYAQARLDTRSDYRNMARV